MASPIFITKQLLNVPPYPKQDLTSQVIIVTGANTGLGYEAAKHFVRLNAARTILACRNEKAGQEAAQTIERETGRKGSTEVWPLDMSSYKSVVAFHEQLKAEPRVDALVLNAGVAGVPWKMAEDDESTITINVVCTMFLAAAALPVLEKSAVKYNVRPRVTVVSSNVASDAKLPVRDATSIFDAMNDKANFNWMYRYPDSKLLEILSVRELAERYSTLKGGKSPVVLDTLSPGLCVSSLARHMTGFFKAVMWFFHTFFARSTEQGGRMLVQAALAGEEAHGKYFNNNVIVEPPTEQLWTHGAEGKRLQEKVWKELMKKFERLDSSAVAYLQ